MLMRSLHKRHRGKFYAFCFMTKCDMDLQSVISTKQHGCLKHLKLQLVDHPNAWEVTVVNMKYILRGTINCKSTWPGLRTVLPTPGHGFRSAGIKNQHLFELFPSFYCQALECPTILCNRLLI